MFAHPYWVAAINLLEVVRYPAIILVPGKPVAATDSDRRGLYPSAETRLQGGWAPKRPKPRILLCTVSAAANAFLDLVVCLVRRDRRVHQQRHLVGPGQGDGQGQKECRRVCCVPSRHG